MKNEPNRKATTGGYLGGARDVVSGRVGAEQRVVQDLPAAAQLRAAFNSKVSARSAVFNITGLQTYATGNILKFAPRASKRIDSLKGALPLRMRTIFADA